MSLIAAKNTTNTQPLHVYPNYYKKCLLFFFTGYKNEHKNINLTTKKIKKSDFYKNKKNISDR